jgi:hypothetical protein
LLVLDLDSLSTNPAMGTSLTSDSWASRSVAVQRQTRAAIAQLL